MFASYKIFLSVAIYTYTQTLKHFISKKKKLIKYIFLCPVVYMATELNRFLQEEFKASRPRDFIYNCDKYYVGYR